MALVTTSLLTPYEVGFLDAPERGDDPLFAINRLIDCIFIVDIVLQCFIAYQDKHGRWVRKPRKIFYRYFRTWMPLDVITAVPRATTPPPLA